MRVDGYSEVVVEESEGFIKNTTNYGVKDPSVIFDILCNTMYNNPLRTMVQEYMCNARDAHREVGTPTRPIEVTLPTRINGHLRIRDFGPGLSPQRMETVFVFLGESTKRDSDTQTGGFGIGAKVGWAYGDSFQIVSCHEGTVRTYLAFMGDGNIGKLSLLKEETTEEPNGVEIQIRIKDGDNYKVENAVNRACYFWRTQPIVHNREYQFTPYDGPRTRAVLCNPPFDSSNPVAVIDGIPYIMDSNVTEVAKYKVLNDKIPCLFFATGQVDLAASRENMRYTEKTLNAIRTLTQSVVADVEAAADNVVSTAADFDSMLENIRNFVLKYSFLGSRTFSLVDGVADIIVSSGQTLLQLHSSVAHETYKLVINRELVSGVSCLKNNNSSWRSDKIRKKINERLYVYNKTTTPPKEKALYAFENYNFDSVVIVGVEDDEIAAKLIAAGLKDFSEVPSSTTSIGRAKADLTKVRIDRKRRISQDSIFPGIHYYIPYKDMNNFESVYNDMSTVLSKLGVRVVYPTQTQEIELRKAGIQHFHTLIPTVQAHLHAKAYAYISRSFNDHYLKNDYVLDRESNGLSEVLFSLDTYSLMDDDIRELCCACEQFVKYREIPIRVVVALRNYVNHHVIDYNTTPAHRRRHVPRIVQRMRKDAALAEKRLHRATRTVQQKFPMLASLAKGYSISLKKELKRDITEYLNKNC